MILMTLQLILMKLNSRISGSSGRAKLIICSVMILMMITCLIILSITMGSQLEALAWMITSGEVVLAPVTMRRQVVRVTTMRHQEALVIQIRRQVVQMTRMKHRVVLMTRMRRLVVPVILMIRMRRQEVPMITLRRPVVQMMTTTSITRMRTRLTKKINRLIHKHWRNSKLFNRRTRNLMSPLNTKRMMVLPIYLKTKIPLSLQMTMIMKILLLNSLKMTQIVQKCKKNLHSKKNSKRCS